MKNPFMEVEGGGINGEDRNLEEGWKNSIINLTTTVSLKEDDNLAL